MEPFPVCVDVIDELLMFDDDGGVKAAVGCYFIISLILQCE